MQIQFNARQFQPAVGYEPVPDGWYPVIIKVSNVVDTKAKDGAYLQLNYEIQDGPHKGKVIFDRLNLFNPNATAVDIANRALTAICYVVGQLDLPITDAKDMAVAPIHGIPFNVRVTVQFDDNKAAIGNNVKNYKDVHGNDPGAAKGGPAPQGGPVMAQPVAAGAPGFAGQPTAAPAGWGGQAPAPAAATAPPAAPAAAPAWGGAAAPAGAPAGGGSVPWGR